MSEVPLQAHAWPLNEEERSTDRSDIFLFTHHLTKISFDAHGGGALQGYLVHKKLPTP